MKILVVSLKSSGTQFLLTGVIVIKDYLRVKAILILDLNIKPRISYRNQRFLVTVEGLKNSLLSTSHGFNIRTRNH